jgi:N-methylhydantoinase A
VTKPLPATTREARATTRKVFLTPEAGYADTLVYARTELAPGQTITGPALIEEYASTTVIFPGDRLEVSPQGDLVITIARS